MITITYQNIHTHSLVHLKKEGVPKVVDNAVSVGMHYVLSIEPGLSVVVTDLVYRENSFVQIKNEVLDSYGLHFFYTNQYVDFIVGDQLCTPSSLAYNCFLLEDSKPVNYYVEKGTKLYSVSVIIDKKLMKNYIKEIVIPNQFIHKILDSEKAIVLYRNSSNTTMKLIKIFKKVPYTNPFYGMYLKGFIYSLMHVFFIEIKCDGYLMHKD